MNPPSNSPADAPTPDTREQIARAQVRLLYTQGPTGIITTLIVGFIVLIAMWSHLPRTVLIAWFVALMGCSLLRYWQVRAYHAQEQQPRRHGLWLRRYRLSTTLSAMVMGFSAPYFALHTPLSYDIFLMFLQGGMAGGALATLGAVLSVYLLYALFMLVPLVVLFLLMGDSIHVTMGLLSTAFVLMQVYAARHINNTYLRSSRLAIENDEMAHHLSRAKARTDATNQSLKAEVQERREAQAALSEEKERAQITLASIGDGVITTDTAQHIEYMNPAAEQRTGWTLGEARGRPLSEVLTLLDEESGEAHHTDFCPVNETDTARTGQAVLVRRDRKKHYSVEFTTTPIRTHGGTAVGAVVVFHDLTALRSMSLELAHQASHDELTGLINRREFELRAKQTLSVARDEGTAHALMYLDLDQFKIVNDTCGHLAGDELLKNIGALLHSCVRSNDILARLGGDEFGVLLEGCELEHARRIAEKMRSHVHEFRFVWEGKRFAVGVSIGLVMVNAQSGNLTDLLSTADSACYIAKEQGRNRIHVYLPQDEVLGHRRTEMEWVSTLQSAITENHFELFGQAVVPITHDASRPTYVEVLLRLRDTQGQIVSPALFIPAAERYQLMHHIDRWVVESALRTLADHIANDKGDAIFAINLSGMSLDQQDFIDFVVERIDASGVPPSRLCFEITETVAISNFARAIVFMRRLQALGCRFALDDFGSGVSSFAYLKSLPVDYLKIYGGFIKDMTDDPVDAAMVRVINDIGHITGRQTIAEWVENAPIMHQLEELGVDYAQGFHIAHPIPLRTCIESLQHHALSGSQGGELSHAGL